MVPGAGLVPRPTGRQDRARSEPEHPQGESPAFSVVWCPAGLEPARLFRQGILNPQCLPFHHPGRVCEAHKENRQRLWQVRLQPRRDKSNLLCTLSLCLSIKVWNRFVLHWMRTMTGRACFRLNLLCQRSKRRRCWSYLRTIRCSRGIA